MLAHMLLAAIGEVAMFVATAANPDEALRGGQASVDTMLTRLFGERDQSPTDAH